MMSHYAALAQYRHTVAEMFAAVRAHPDPAQAAQSFRTQKDTLYKESPLSPVPAEKRETFSGLPYAEYDPAWRFVLPIDFEVEPKEFSGEVTEGILTYKRFGIVHFAAPTGEQGALSLFWLTGYGGGVFVPFRDASNGTQSYGGGRYLIDTIKGADLGITPTHITLDFNFAYHPSCCYSHLWVCPLAPPENRLPFSVPVGELL